MPIKLADRRQQIDSSGIRKVFDLAAKLKDPCNLSIGLPDYDVPDPVKEAAIAAIRAGRNRYTVTAGIPDLREKVRRRYLDRGLPAEDVFISSGTSGGLFLCFMALLNPGDEIMMADPWFVMYNSLSAFIGAKPVYIDTYPDFRLTREKLDAVWTPRAKILLVNSPNNPTGMVYSREELELAGAFAREKGMLFMTDEIYEDFLYDGEFVSPAHYSDPDKTIIISGLSKNVAMTGWRLGWVAGPKDLIAALSDIQQYSFVCAPSPAQYAAMEALDYDMTAVRTDYRKRRDMIHAGLERIGLEVARPGGAFYIFPKAPIDDAEAFVHRCIEKELLVVPGKVFSRRNTHFRMSFAAAPAQIERGIGILERLVQDV